MTTHVVVSKERRAMTKHMTGTRKEWLAARLELLEAEKELTRRSDELAQRRQELPWVRIDKEYRFDTDEGSASLADLFRGRSQLLVYHYMFGADYTAGCATCSTIADGFNGFAVHLGNADVNASFTEEQQREGGIEYNYRREPAWQLRSDEGMASRMPGTPVGDNAAMTGTDPATYTRERPGMSAFVLEDGVVYHSYST